jgi:hypothetical protein
LKEENVIVKNVNGTSEGTCKCESWLDHWERFSGQSPTLCPVAECLNFLEVGAHVQKTGFTDTGWYIIPLCQKHNAKTGESLMVNDNVKMVSANASGTCG